MTRLARWAWAVLGWNLVVILWGAYVRATGSGAGCGAHWPLCDGQVVPRAPSAEQAIEYAHRVTSGLALLAVVAFLVAAFRSRPAGHPVRRTAVWALALILVEAGLGAGLVLFELVADDASTARAASMAAHLVNTFLLLGALALNARAADDRPLPRLGERRTAALAWLACLALLALAGASGAVAALGDTLFPSSSLAEALAADLDPTSHLLVRLRVAHPTLAAVAAAAVLLLASSWALAESAGAGRGVWARSAIAITLSQVAVGLANLALLAPIPLQLVHLLGADLLWISLVLAGAERFAPAPSGS
ncbi:MAG TPA: COX15/CtaA family protein [Thermoanaerobaculia bacterium]|nr:COX15/CtaA family protein [Thermoanaerobaculia bacterium]